MSGAVAEIRDLGVAVVFGDLADGRDANLEPVGLSVSEV